MSAEQSGNDRPINHERLEQSAERYERPIAHGIREARLNQTEISLGTARLIATALSRALGRSSALAEYGRTGAADESSMRDEYLALYCEPTTPPEIKEWIDWLGTFVLSQQNQTSGRSFLNEHLPPKLDLLLVRHELTIRGRTITSWLPAGLTSEEVADAAKHLQQLDILDDDALRAFVSLPDVNAAHDVLMESFHASFVGSFPDVAAALRSVTELTAWEVQLHTFALRRGIDPSAISIDLSLLAKQAAFAFDFVEAEGVVHVFHK